MKTRSYNEKTSRLRLFVAAAISVFVIGAIVRGYLRESPLDGNWRAVNSIDNHAFAFYLKLYPDGTGSYNERSLWSSHEPMILLKWRAQGTKLIIDCLGNPPKHREYTWKLDGSRLNLIDAGDGESSDYQREVPYTPARARWL